MYLVTTFSKGEPTGMRKSISIFFIIAGIFLVIALFGCQKSVIDSASTGNDKVSLPAAFPDDFPIYKGTKLVAAKQDLDVSGKPLYTAYWESNDDSALVTSFYDQALAGGSWLITKKSQPSPAIKQYDFHHNNDSKNLPKGSLRVVKDPKTGKTVVMVKILDKSD